MDNMEPDVLRAFLTSAHLMIPDPNEEKFLLNLLGSKPKNFDGMWTAIQTISRLLPPGLRGSRIRHCPNGMGDDFERLCDRAGISYSSWIDAEAGLAMLYNQFVYRANEYLEKEARKPSPIQDNQLTLF